MNAEEMQKEIEKEVHKSMANKGYTSGHINRETHTSRRRKRGKEE